MKYCDIIIEILEDYEEDYEEDLSDGFRYYSDDEAIILKDIANKILKKLKIKE